MKIRVVYPAPVMESPAGKVVCKMTVGTEREVYQEMGHTGWLLINEGWIHISRCLVLSGYVQ